mmetsp:Transcript_103222/g.245841  ORF Transcript_103222/g.245841 Transcript_103222/m.245841 type:complete len:208 (+) Transcript_103222:395-1018(+)
MRRQRRRRCNARRICAGVASASSLSLGPVRGQDIVQQGLGVHGDVRIHRQRLQRHLPQHPLRWRRRAGRRAAELGIGRSRGHPGDAPGALLQQNGRGSARQAGSPSDAHRASVSHRARHVAVAHTTRHTHLPHGANLPHGAYLPHGTSLPHGADLAHGTDLPHGGHLPHGAHLSHGTDLPHRAHGAELCRATPLPRARRGRPRLRRR